MKHYDVIIVGGGATGASALYHLANRGITNTLLIEKKEGFGRGATGSWGSLIRVFHVSLDVTQRASRSVPFHLDYEKHVGHPSHFTQLGSLYFLKKAQLTEFREHLFALEASGLEFHLIEAKEGRERFPDFSWYEDDVAVYEPGAGVACPWATTEGMIKHAQSKGADAILNSKVSEILSDGQGRITRVVTEAGETYGCDKLVLATGIWTMNLLEPMGTTVAAYPEVIQLNRFCRQHAEEKKNPIFVDLFSRTFGHSSFNNSFIGGHISHSPQTPKRRNAIQHVSLHAANKAKHKLSTRLPWIKNATLEGGMRAIDSYTESKKGLTHYDPKYGNLLISTGWSCGGFTTSPENGKTIADRLIEC